MCILAWVFLATGPYSNKTDTRSYIPPRW